MKQPEAKKLTAGDISVGLKASFETEVREQDIKSFAELSGDHNPLHVDSAYAAGTNYQNCIAHGAYQMALVSSLAGMQLPGQNCLILSVDCRFLAPLYYPTRVRLEGEVSSWNAGSLTGKLTVTMTDVKAGAKISEFFVRFSLHDSDSQISAAADISANVKKSGSVSHGNTVLVTGATGGLGQLLLNELAAAYDILAVGRDLEKIPSELPGNVTAWNIDFEDPDWSAQLEANLNGQELYGVVHAAWPGMPKGGLLKSDPALLARQLAFGSEIPIELGRVLKKHAPKTGGRFLAIGSSAGSHHPNPAIASYSLGKAALEQTIRLLAPELAGQGITANVIAPVMIPVGINKQITERQRILEEARIPAGRLCAPDDMMGMVRFLLSGESSFVSGQVLHLTGAQI